MVLIVTGSMSTSPDATTPAARPATVPSTMYGKTLFVPVDMGTSGTLPDPLATALLVPSPPSVTMHETPISAIAFAARVESPSAPAIAMSSITASRPCGDPLAAEWHNMPVSGIITTRSTGVAARPASTRRRMLTFSLFGTNRPCATRRLMSLPAAGFAMIPTVDMPLQPLPS